MITVTFWPSKDCAPVVAEIAEGRDPFEVCAMAEKRLGLKKSPERDERFERVMLARDNAAPQVLDSASLEAGKSSPQRSPAVAAPESPPPREPIREAATKVERQSAELPARAGVRDTSMAAYRALAWSGTMAAQQRAVLDVFLREPERTWTRRELVNAVGVPVNAITGRVNELLREPFELIEECGRRSCSVTGESVNELRLKRNA